MKRNLLGLFAVVLAIAISSFTVRKNINVYFVYKDNGGAHSIVTNYNQVSSETTRLGADFLAWIRVADDNGTVTSTEWQNAFEVLDTVNDAANDLDDEVEKTINVGSYTYQLEKKS